MKTKILHSIFYEEFSKNLWNFRLLTKILRETQNIKFFKVAKRLRDAAYESEKFKKQLLIMEREKSPQEMELKDLQFILKFFKHITTEKLEFYLNKYFLIILYSEFEKYFYKILKYNYVKYPESLKFHSVSIETILNKKNNIDLIIEDKAEKVVLDLLYKDFTGFFKTIAKKPIGLKIDIDSNQINKLDEFKQIRNAYIHGDGKVSLIYLSRVQKSNKKLGDILELNQSIIGRYERLAFGVVKKVDKVLIDKFPELIFKSEVQSSESS